MWYWRILCVPGLKPPIFFSFAIEFFRKTAFYFMEVLERDDKFVDEVVGLVYESDHEVYSLIGGIGEIREMREIRESRIFSDISLLLFSEGHTGIACCLAYAV